MQHRKNTINAPIEDKTKMTGPKFNDFANQALNKIIICVDTRRYIYIEDVTNYMNI